MGTTSPTKGPFLPNAGVKRPPMYNLSLESEGPAALCLFNFNKLFAIQPKGTHLA